MKPLRGWGILTSLIVLIPTRLRPELLNKALDSVALQNVRPSKVLILVNRDENIQEIQSTASRFQDTLPVEIILNERTQNLSGAINSGLDSILHSGFPPEETYVALLDDDDYWEPRYLETCMNAALEDQLDWVITGIIRHESKDGEGHCLSIPYRFSVEDFLVSNPHIQGSNLFLRLSVLLSAGGFDEALESTTDRDVCIRLLHLPDIKYRSIQQHLVHHMALSDRDRLSTRGSRRKQWGLQVFFQKYVPLMTIEQRDKFRKRAQRLFSIEIKDIVDSAPHHLGSTESAEHPSTPIPVVVGIIASRPKSTENLLEDLVKLNLETPFIARTVITDNSPSSEALQRLISKKKYKSLNISLRSRDGIEFDCETGKLGMYLQKKEHQRGIAPGRTILHYYTFLEANALPCAVVWVIDDDIRLDYLDKDRGIHRITAKEIQTEIMRLKRKGVSIGVTQVTGDPPIPALSTLRTQLLDLLYNLKRLTNDDTFDFEKLREMNKGFMRRCPEYYYDFSEAHYTHLETPIWYPLETGSLPSLNNEITQILFGKDVTRPVVKTQFTETEDAPQVIPTGGSYLVLNLECLRQFMTISAKLGDFVARRGDTFWSILNQRVGGYQVAHSQLALRQERTSETQNALSLDSLLTDFIGSSFVRAMSQFFETKVQTVGTFPARISLTFSEQDIRLIISLFEEALNRRITRFLFNSYRTRGLVSAIKELPIAKKLAGVHDLVQNIEGIFTTEEIQRFLINARDLPKEDLQEFLYGLKDNIRDYSSKIINSIQVQHQISHAREIIERILGLRELGFLGKGQEGTTFTDGKSAYKYFRYGRAHFEANQLAFIKEKLLGVQCENIVRLERVIEEDGEVIFQTELMKGEGYSGGHLESLLQLLRDCQNIGVAITNIHPKNLLVDGKTVKFCDLGRSLVPLNEREFREMAKRTYLTYRFHFRKDLADVMKRALSDETIPELFGFEYFLRALQTTTKHEVLDNRLVDMILQERPTNVLDYGCGNGRITEKLAVRGLQVFGYDIDDGIISRNKERTRRGTYLNSEELQRLLDDGVVFDLIICNLVLCTIQNDAEFEKVLSNIRKLVAMDGKVLLSVCNPFFTSVKESESHWKPEPRVESAYHSAVVYQKVMKETDRARIDVHRPYSTYEQSFYQNGFEISKTTELSSTDIAQLLPSSDFLLFELKPLAIPRQHQVSLLIKASPIEWRTIEFQIRHIVKQLEGPQQFVEKIVITDTHDGPFLRQYSQPNHSELKTVLNRLVDEGIIDRVVYAPISHVTIRATYQKWFALESTQTHSQHGQHIYTTLYGFDQCTSKYILQLDSDCLIFRKNRNHDYLSDLISVLERDPNALTVSFGIAQSQDIPYTWRSEKGDWRVEVRCSLIHKERLEASLPLPNEITQNGRLANAWHRALDQRISDTEWKSYRGGNHQVYFIHIPNDRKENVTEWYNILKAVERCNIPSIQYGSVDLKGELVDWLGGRQECFVFLVRGRDVLIPRIRRCIDTLRQQSRTDWGVILIDASSENGMNEYLESVLLRELSDKATLLLNWEPLPPIENIWISTTKLAENEESVIVHVDIDDALIGSEVLTRLAKAYDTGADVTVGSMIRTDKHVAYPVEFDNPRENRGGNVWQHLRTFRKYLFNAIRVEDLKINGEWVPLAEDWAFMLPIVELAQKPIQIEEVLYFYDLGKGKDAETRQIRESVIEQIVRKPVYSTMMLMQ